MENQAKIFQDDKVNIKELMLTLWHGKIYILFFSAFFVFLASMYLQNAERIYLVEYKLKPVGENQQKNKLSGLGGIASLAGIELPSSSINDFEIFKELIFSAEVAEEVLKNKSLIKKIYGGEWNSFLQTYSEPSKTKFRIFMGDLKNILTGNYEDNYMPPNARRLAIYISQNISINEDRKTGFLTLRAETSQPNMLLSVISNSIEESDKIMRQRYIDFSKEPLEFYTEKLRTARSREHREALAELISKEEQKLMFASKGKYFTAEPYIDPTISMYPVTPRPKIVLLFSLILGLFTGCGIVFIRNLLTKR